MGSGFSPEPGELVGPSLLVLHCMVVEYPPNLQQPLCILLLRPWVTWLVPPILAGLAWRRVRSAGAGWGSFTCLGVSRPLADLEWLQLGWLVLCHISSLVTSLGLISWCHREDVEMHKHFFKLWFPPNLLVTYWLK